MELFDNIAQKKTHEMIVAKLDKINVKAGACRYNFRCHLNAVHDAITFNQDKIAMCFYVDNGRPIIHFLNVDSDGKYTDNTLGHWSTIYSYYLIRHIDKESFFDVSEIFTLYRKGLRKELSWITRLFSNIEF